MVASIFARIVAASAVQSYADQAERAAKLEAAGLL